MDKIVYLLIVLYTNCLVFATALEKADLEEKSKEKSGKLFSLFSVVTFKNKQCNSASGTTGTGANRNGTCYTQSECSSHAGTASGACASGFGVCCLFIVDSSGTITHNNSYIQNPSYPSAYTGTSSFTWTVSKCQKDVCALRFDFETFTTAGPTDSIDATTCVDTFKVTASPSGDVTPVICGENTGSHIYMDIGPDSGAYATINMDWGTNTNSISRLWEIKVSQIECWSRAKPESGCLQYYTGSTGRFTSFNFQQSSSSYWSHLPSQLQHICIRAEAGMCCIKYSLCGDTNSFTIDNTAAAVVGTSCVNDYVDFVEASANCHGALTSSRWCGGFLAESADATASIDYVCDCTLPFTATFHTNAATAETITTTANRGICFQYQQVGCSNTNTNGG